jgi:alginate O-acetyltransferase complex protein AlgI
MAANFVAGLAIGTLRGRPPDAETTGRRRVTAKGLLVVTVVADLLVIGFWKYLGFTSGIVHSVGRALGLGDTTVLSLALPIGISFFTFHHLSYVIDVYRGVRPPLRNPLTFTT